MRHKGEPLDGVLLLDKPRGITSNAALQQAKRVFGAAKAGHTGTLDPLATGLLPICFGEATKFSALLLDAEKTYLALIRLGAATTTGDAEGEVTFRGDVGAVDVARVTAMLGRLAGPREQVPPMYSALKYQGRPLYHYARAGHTVERASRTVTIHELIPISIAADTIEIRLRVSKGTYVRAIAEDIGQRLGCGAHLEALRREVAGGLSLEHAVTLDALSTLSDSDRRALLRPMDILVSGLPKAELDAVAADQLRQGRKVRAAVDAQSGIVRLYDLAGTFLGVGQVHGPGEIAPQRLVCLRAPGHGA